MQSQPASLSAFSTHTELGQLKAEFPHNTGRLVLPILTLGFFCFVVGCGCLDALFGALLKSHSYSALGGLVLIVLLGWLMFRGEFHGRLPYAAALYENGFACLGGSGLIQVHWEQIDKLEEMVGESVTIEGPPFTLTMEGTEAHFYSVVTKNGMKVILSEKILHVKKLWAAIQEGVASSKGEVAVKG